MITNLWVGGNGDLCAVRALREAVFVEEQGIPFEQEFDFFDEQAMHLVLFEEQQPIATGRLYFDGKDFVIGRLCVKKELRRQGVGDLLIKLLLVKAFSFADHVALSAQMRVRGFYEKYGFAAQGTPYDECGIEHILMRVDEQSLVFPSECGKGIDFAALTASGLITKAKQ